MKKYLILFFLFLISCWKTQVVDEKMVKTDFLIETKNFSELENNYFLEKSSKIEPSSEVDILFETSARVENISIKEWENVISWQKLISLVDNSWNINTNYKQALLNLESAKIQYDTNKISLDKSVLDSEMNLEKLKTSLENTKKSLNQDLLQAKDNLQNSDLTNKNSKSSLDIQKIDNSIEKMELEYKTQLKSNKDKIDSFILNLRKEKDNLKDFYTKVINFWDTLFSVTNPYSKEKYYEFLWAWSYIQKNEAENSLKEIIEYNKNILSKMDIKSESDLNKFIDNLDESYKKVKKFLDLTFVTLNNSLTWLENFTDSQKQAFLWELNWYMSSYSWNYSWFISQKSNIIWFLNTYKDSEESLKKQIELVKKDKDISKKIMESSELSSKVSYEKILISSDDTISNLESQIKSAEINLENAKKTREITLKNIENSIKNAELWVEKASIEAWKLVLKAPISWQISKIEATVWQTYNPWVKALTLISSSKRELDIFVSAEDLEKINIWDKVFVDYRWEKLEWEIFSKSNVANETLNYKVKVSLKKQINLIWWVVNVSFVLKSKFPLIPVNFINILSSEKSKKIWEINILKNWKIEKMEVELWEVYGKNIEIKTELDKNLQIILSDVSNFSEEKFDLKIK